MAVNFIKHTWQKIAWSALLILVVIGLVLGYFFNEHWSPILAKKLHDEVLKSSDSLYNANFTSAEFHLFQGKVVIFNITLKADTAVYVRLKKRGLAPNNLLDLHVKRLVINHIHPFKLYFQHILDFEQIVLSAPEIHISYQLNHTKDTTQKDNRTVWQKISKSLHSVHIGDIFLNDVQFRYDDMSGNKVEVSELKQMDVHASDLLIDSLTQTDTSRFLLCKDIVTELNDYTGKTPSGLYTYTIKYLKLSSRTYKLNAEGIDLKPRSGFFDKTHNDKYSFHLDSVELNRFDYLSYHKYRRFNVESIVLDRGSFSLFTNPNREPNSNDKIRSFPNVVLSTIPANIKVDSIIVRHLNIDYTELNQRSKQTGTITFNNTNGKFFNITNNALSLQKNNTATARLTTYFMGRGELSLVFGFNLNDKDAAYTYKGTLGKMNLKLVNPAAMPLGMVKINEGTLNQLEFDFKANSHQSNGRVTALYNNLKVTVLKPDTDNAKLKRQTIASLYANIFILKHNNPDNEGEAPRSFNVNFQRPADMSFFKFTWQSLLAGIKPSVGYDKNKQEATKALVANIVIKKQERIMKRAERKARRAERREKRAEKKAQKEADKNPEVQEPENN